MKYKLFAKSFPGSKYQKKGWPCQDNSGKYENDNMQVIALADGHGSYDCFRSEIGSKIAVETAIEESRKALIDKEGNFSDTGIQNFKFALWNAWRKKVKIDWDKHKETSTALGEGELRYKTVSEKYKTRFTSEEEDIRERYLYTAYGTTLLCAISIDSQVLLLQIGDGTCVILRRNGEFCVPMPIEEENFMNVTVSLCDENAYEKIRHIVIDSEEDDAMSPVAAFLSSDGLDDCYPYEGNEKFLYKNVYTSIVKNIITEGYDATENEIRSELLPYMTEKGSKDDISLAYFIVENVDLLKEAYENIPSFLATIDTNAQENDVEITEMG